jgi:hypothetical protein
MASRIASRVTARGLSKGAGADATAPFRRSPTRDDKSAARTVAGIFSRPPGRLDTARLAAL